MSVPIVYVISNSEENALDTIFDATLSTYDIDEAKKVAKRSGQEVFMVTLTKIKI